MKYILLTISLLYLSGCTGIVINIYDSTTGAELHSQMHDFKEDE